MAETDRCAVCGQPFQDCPHSFKDVDDFKKRKNDEAFIRKIVREEVNKLLSDRVNQILKMATDQDLPKS